MTADLEVRLRAIAVALDAASEAFEQEPDRDRVRTRTPRFGVLIAVAAVVLAGSVAGSLLVQHDDRIRTVDGVDEPSPPSNGIVVTPPPEGVATTLTVDQVEQVVLDQIHHDERAIGKALVPARILSVTYMIPGKPYDLGRGASIDEAPPDSWLVRYRGTTLSCSSWCSAHLGGTVTVGSNGGGSALSDPVCHPEGLIEVRQPPIELPPC